jgi:hypothetical protein
MPLDYPFPPWSQAVKLFDYDTSEPLAFTEVDREYRGGAWVSDVHYRSSGYVVPAWLVIPDGAGPFPVVLYAHGRTGTAGRDWFLDDALALARDGYAGLLITGPDTREPFLTADTGDAQLDIGANVQYATDLRRGLDPWRRCRR